MIIRDACTKDTDQILVLTNDVADKHGLNRPDIFKQHPYHISKEKIEHNIESETHRVIVAEENEVIIGVILCSIRCYLDDAKYKDSKIISIEDTCIAPAFRGQRVGSKLLEYIKEIAREIGCCRLEVNVWSFNLESEAFFRANGFTDQRIVMEYCADDK